MKKYRSHWATIVDNAKKMNHVLITYIKNPSPEMADIHLAKIIGENDPHIIASEKGLEIALGDVQTAIVNREQLKFPFAKLG